MFYVVEGRQYLRSWEYFSSTIKSREMMGRATWLVETIDHFVVWTFSF